MAKEYIVRVKADTKEFEEGIKKVDKGVQGVEGSTAHATGALDKFTGGAVSAFSKGLQGAKQMALGMKTLRGAIISTGIGALVIAIVAVVQAVSRLQVVQDKYKVATAGLSAVLDVLLDKLAYLGEFIINTFTEDPLQAIKDFGQILLDNIVNRFEGIIKLVPRLGEAVVKIFQGDFKGAAELAGNAVAQVVTGVEDLTGKLQGDEFQKFANELLEVKKRAEELERVEQRLLDLQIKQITTQAERSKQIAEARLLAEDETKTFEEREEALRAALELENKNLEERLANARVEANLVAQRNSLSESSRDDLRAEAEAKAKVSQLEEASLRQQKRIFTELQSLQKQRQAAEEKVIAERIKAEEELQKAQDEINQALIEGTLSAQEKEILASEQKYNKLIELAMKFGQDTTELEEAQNQALAAIQQKYRDQADAEEAKSNEKKLAQSKELENQRISLAQNAFGAISAISEAFAGADEARAKKAFQVSKLVGIAEATVNAYTGVTTALAGKGADGLLPFPIRLGNAVIAGATGLAQVAKIKSSSFGGSGGGGAPSISGGGGSAPSAPQTPTVDFGFLNQGANQTSVQAYVISNQVTNSQQSQQLIEDQAAL
jgi:chemotaxis protein histidine kinase CheA